MAEDGGTVGDDAAEKWSEQIREAVRAGSDGLPEFTFTPGPDGYYPPHRPECFGCGPENDVGLQLRLQPGPDGTVMAEYRFPDRFQGGPGVAHGGAIAAVMDDVLGTVCLTVGKPAVTGRLTVNYRRPVVVGHKMTVTARLHAESGRRIIVRGEMRDSADRVVADAEALMIRIEFGHFTRFAAELPPDEESVPDEFKPFLPDENYP